MKRPFLSYLLLITVLASLFAPPTGMVEAAVSLPISAPSALLLDDTAHHFTYIKTPHLRRPPASTTKLLTAIVALESLGLNAVITIPAYIERTEPSKINLRRGERYRVRELIQATLINSANDAAEALAFAAGRGSRAKFAAMMNAKAKRLGCKNSHFVNPSGLPAAGQYSSAYDMALIMRELQRYPFLFQTLKTRTLLIKSAGGRRVYLRNHNKWLWRDRREVVGKTGWTRLARHCFVGRMSVNGRKVFVAMLGSHRLWQDLKALVDYQFGAAYIRALKNQKIWGTDETKRIQSALKRAGFNPGKADGRFGPATIKAVQGFQRSRGLKPDGVVGPQTFSSLKRYYK